MQSSLLPFPAVRRPAMFIENDGICFCPSERGEQVGGFLPILCESIDGAWLM
jgi:hypothetical protein